MTIQTRRLLLRPWTEADAPALYKYASDPDIGPAAGWAVHPNVEHSREILRTTLIAEHSFALTLPDTDEPIGSIGLFGGDTCSGGELELGYWLGKPYWGQGLMSEACRAVLAYGFEALHCRRIWCSHFRGNEKSRRVMEKCGFQPVFYKEYTTQTGERRISKYYALRREEFRAYG